MARRVVFFQQTLGKSPSNICFRRFRFCPCLCRKGRVFTWIVLTLGEDCFAVIREGQDLWSLLDMPKFLNAATAPSWVWWDDQQHWGRNDKGTVNHTRDRESFGRALGHDGPWKILQWKCFASIRCRFLAFQWKYARIQSSKKLLVMPGCSLGGCSLRGPFPDPFLTEGATDRSPKSEPIFFDFRKWGGRRSQKNFATTRRSFWQLGGSLCVQHHGRSRKKKESRRTYIVSLCCCNHWNLGPFWKPSKKCHHCRFAQCEEWCSSWCPDELCAVSPWSLWQGGGWNIFTDDD